jgi:hypothetical protein
MSIRTIIKGALTVEHDMQFNEVWIDAVYPDTPSQPLMQVVCERVTEPEAAEIMKELIAAHHGYEFILGPEIVAERQKQDDQWGGPTHDDSHERFEWVGFMQKFLERAREFGYIDCGVEQAKFYEENLIKVAALCVAAVQASRRQR